MNAAKAARLHFQSDPRRAQWRFRPQRAMMADKIIAAAPTPLFCRNRVQRSRSSMGGSTSWMASKTAAKPIKIDAAIQTSLRSRRVCATGGLSGPAWSGWARRALRDSAMTADPAVRVGPAHRRGGKRGDARQSSPRVVDGDGGRARVERRDARGAGGEGNARGSLTNAARRRGAAGRR